MQKDSKSNEENKDKETLPKPDNSASSPSIVLKEVNLQEQAKYNPFNNSENDNNKESPKDSNQENDFLKEEDNREIIDINTPSKQSAIGNEEEDWNSSNERNKEKLKKDLLENNNNNKNNSSDWGGNKNSSDWGGSSNNNNKDDNKPNNEKLNEFGGSNKDNNLTKNDKEENKMKFENEDDTRDDNGPLPEAKETEDMFDNIVEEKNKKESESTWFNRDGRDKQDPYGEIQTKKLLSEHQIKLKFKEDKISELESMKFKMYFVKVNTDEEPKLLEDKVRPKIRFENLNKVPEQLKKNLKTLKFDYLTPVQRGIMPYIQIGKDIVCVSETGCGKTLSYLFPIIGRMLIEGVPGNPYIVKENKNNNKESKEGKEEKEEKVEKEEKEEKAEEEKIEEEKTKEKIKRTFINKIAYPICLIIAPTRELVKQISEESTKLAMDTGIKTVSLYGGKKFQDIDLSKGCEILVSTPGKLSDYVNKKNINLGMVKYLVLDEGERLLEPDFYEQLKNIFDNLPKRKFRQNLLFSATFNDDVKGIARYCLNNYYYFISQGEIPKQIKHIFYHFQNNNEKVENLIKYLKSDEVKNKFVLIFMNSRKGVEDLNKILNEENIKSCIIHSAKTQNDRHKSIREFSLGYKRILISTDLTSRGMDFPSIYSVINFDMPNNIDDYIHRTGRAGRLGQDGIAITYVDSIDDTTKERLIEILNTIGQEVPKWINEIESKKIPYQFLNKKKYSGFENNKRDSNDDNWTNKNRNDRNFNRDNNRNFNRDNNRNFNRDNNRNNNRNNNWGNKDNNEGWGNNNENKKNEGWGDNNENGGSNNTNNKNENKEDNWGSSSNNNNEWGGNQNKNNNDTWGDNTNNNKERKDSWGSNKNNEQRNNTNNNKDRKNSWGSSKNDEQRNNTNNNKDRENSWGSNKNNEQRNNTSNNKDRKDSWGSNKNNNNWGENSKNNENNSWGRNSYNNNDNRESNDNFNNRNSNFTGRGKGFRGGRGRGRERENNNSSNFNNIQENDINIPEDAFEELFVMGINYKSTEDNLKETFSKYGEINTCKILKDKDSEKSRGIGFVKFIDKKSAVLAMNDADNLICQGRNLRVRYANNKNGEIKGKKFDKNNDRNNNREERFDRGNRERGRGGRGRGRGRGSGRNNENNNDNSWGNNNNDSWDNNKGSNNNNTWGKNENNKNDTWENNNNDSWGDDKNGSLKNNNNALSNDEAKKDKSDQWGNNNNNKWGSSNERERSRDKDNNDDNW